MSSNRSLVLKVCIGEDIHRITLKSRVKFEELKEKVEKHCAQRIASLRWIDDHKDQIAMFNDLDLDELYNFVNQFQLDSVRIEAFPYATNATQTPSSVVSQPTDLPPRYSNESDLPDEMIDDDDDDDDDDEDDEDDEDAEGYDAESIAKKLTQQQTNGDDPFKTLFTLLKDKKISLRAYKKILKKSVKFQKRRERVAKVLARMKQHRIFNIEEYERKIAALVKVSPILEQDPEMHLLIASQMVMSQRFNNKMKEKPIKMCKKMTQDILNELSLLSSVDLPHGQKVAKLLIKKYNTDYKSKFTPEILQLARNFEGLGVPQFIVCKILVKNPIH